MRVSALSELAASFPTVEVPYEDLLTLQHRTDCRCEGGYTDCLGVVLEIYRRAGLRLPDARLSGPGVTDWYKLFSEVPAPDQLYDLIYTPDPHIWVVIRHGEALSSGRTTNVVRHRTSAVARIKGVKFYRLRPECYP